MIRRYLNGETWRRRPPSLHTESIGMQREPGELKHLSSRRKRKQHVIPGVAASERGRAQTTVFILWGSDCIRYLQGKRNGTGKTIHRA